MYRASCFWIVGGLFGGVSPIIFIIRFFLYLLSQEMLSCELVLSVVHLLQSEGRCEVNDALLWQQRC